VFGIFFLYLAFVVRNDGCYSLCAIVFLAALLKTPLDQVMDDMCYKYDTAKALRSKIRISALPGFMY